MPSVKDFENKKDSSEESEVLDLEAKRSKGSRRRPGRDGEEAIAKAESIVAEAEEAMAESETNMADSEAIADDSEDTYKENMNEFSEGPEGLNEEEKKESPFKRIRVNIKGHEVLNIETPEKVVQLVDAVVEDWKTDGSFNGIPLDHPLAKFVATTGLRKAKDVEKKLEEKGVFAIAQMGLSILKSKLKK